MNQQQALLIAAERVKGSMIEIICIECGATIIDKAKLSVLCFERYTCPACGKVSVYPIPKKHVQGYWGALVIFGILTIIAILRCQFVFPGLLVIISAVALYNNNERKMIVANKREQYFPYDSRGEIPDGKPDPKMKRDLITVGQHFFDNGVTEFEDWSTDMKEEIGEWVEPYLQHIFSEIQNCLTPPPLISAPEALTPETGTASKSVDVEAARIAELEAKFKRMGIVTHPEEDLQDMIELGALYIKRGAREFNEWRKNITEMLGEQTDIFLRDLYAKACLYHLANFGPLEGTQEQEQSIEDHDEQQVSDLLPPISEKVDHPQKEGYVILTDGEKNNSAPPNNKVGKMSISERLRICIVNNKLLFIIGIILLMAFAVFVWPTRYRYDNIRIAGNTFRARTDRISGIAEILTLEGWHIPQKPETPTKEVEVNVPLDQIFKIGGTAGLNYSGNIFSGMFYNGTYYKLTSMLIHISYANFSRDYFTTCDVDPLTSCLISITVDGEITSKWIANNRKQYDWSVVNAKGILKTQMSKQLSEYDEISPPAREGPHSSLDREDDAWERIQK